MPVESMAGVRPRGQGSGVVLVTVTGQQGHCWSLPGWRRWELLVLLVLLSQESAVAGEQPTHGGEKRKKSLPKGDEMRKEHELVCCFLLHGQT